MKNITLTAQQIYDIFVNRTDVFAMQLDTGAYVPVRRDITIKDIEEHLAGKVTLGLYVLNKQNMVRWACIDLDGTDLDMLKAEAMVIYKQFKDFPRMLEFSGRRGYHIWVFFTPSVNAGYVQKLIKARLNRISLGHYEVYPKQTTLNKDRLYGNLVKVVHALHRVSKKRSEILMMDKVKL
jgi:hypothetical protein